MPRNQHRSDRRARSAGFALIVTIWALGIVTLLGSLVIVDARQRAMDIGVQALAARAETAAKSGMMLGVAAVMSADAVFWRSPTLICSLPDGSRLRVVVSREAGKVDLNAAPPILLAQLFAALTGDAREGADLAAALVVFRTKMDGKLDPAVSSAYAAAGRPEGPKRAPFSSVLELDQVLGMSPALLTATLPHVTVLSGRPDLDLDAATPALLKLLGLSRRDADPASLFDARQGAGQDPVSIEAEALTRQGFRARRAASVLFKASTPNGFTMRDWRGVAADPSDPWPQSSEAGRPCLFIPGRTFPAP